MTLPLSIVLRAIKISPSGQKTLLAAEVLPPHQAAGWALDFFHLVLPEGTPRPSRANLTLSPDLTRFRWSNSCYSLSLSLSSPLETLSCHPGSAATKTYLDTSSSPRFREWQSRLPVR